MSDFSIKPSGVFHEIHPHARVGVMVVKDVCNPAQCPELDQLKLEIEAGLRQRFADKAMLREHPILQAYKSYYKAFEKTYHVQAQLESVAFGGRSIPSTDALVEAMFMAELDNMLLTAGHDLDRLNLPLLIDLGSADRNYEIMNGNLQNLKKNDVCMADQQGVISSVIYGPDRRTRLSPSTRNALFVVYAPEGIQQELIEKHFSNIFRYVALFSPAAHREYSAIL